MFEKIKQRYMFWLLRLLPNCDQTTRLMSDAMDRSLSLKQRILMGLHLHVCDWCKQYRNQIALLRQVFRRSATEEKEEDVFPDASLSSEAKKRIKRSISPE